MPKKPSRYAQRKLSTYSGTMTVDEVLDEVEKDASFYRTTGGGMTLSGGECQLQPDSVLHC